MKNRDKINQIKKLYTKCPNRILELNLHPSAIAIAFLFCSVPENFEPSTSYLVNVLGLKRATIHKYINQLILTKVIYCYSRGSIAFESKPASNNLYAFNSPKLWIRLVNEGSDKKSLYNV